MMEYNLGPVEGKFADIVWENAPLTTKRLVELCGEALQWKRTTTYSVLKKLCDKGFFQMENSLVTVLVSKEQYQSIQSRNFVNEKFHGSLPALILSFGAEEKLSDSDIDELQSIIDSMRG